MAKSYELFEVVADKLATVQKSLVALLLFAACYSVADLLAAHFAARSLSGEFLKHRMFTMEAEDIAARLRYTLSHLYPEREFSERQRLQLLIHDVRRVRRMFESPDGVDATLSKYDLSILPLEGGNISRASLQQKLDRGNKLAYFNIQQPGYEPTSIQNAFINVGINDLTAESGINQLPVSHLALLLLGSLSVPNELASALETFMGAGLSTNVALKTLDESLGRVNERGGQLDQSAWPNGVKSENLAMEFLKSFIGRSLDSPFGEEASVRASKYANASIDDLNRLLVEVSAAYYAEHSRALGARVVDVPGTSVRLPGYLFLLGLPLLLLILIFMKANLAARGHGAPLPEGATLESIEIKYGYGVVALLGYRPAEGRRMAILQVCVVAFVPLALAAPIAITRGFSTLAISIPLALVVMVSELRLARKSI